ncbi:hypothetical protein CCP3SC1_40050 [Gammaproteobacteria bacterium]
MSSTELSTGFGDNHDNPCTVSRLRTRQGNTLGRITFVHAIPFGFYANVEPTGKVMHNQVQPSGFAVNTLRKDKGVVQCIVFK